MPAACSLSHLTPEQRAAGKRVAIAFFVAKGLQFASLIALMVYLTTSSTYRPRLTAIWGVSTILSGLFAGRYCMARLKQIETGNWPRKRLISWLWDFVLLALIAVMLIVSW